MSNRKVELVAARRNLGLSRKQAAKKLKMAEETLKRAEEGEFIYDSNKKLIVDFYKLGQVTDVWPVEELLQ